MRQVAIVGLSPSEANQAPWYDNEWEIWCLPWDNRCEAGSLWFEMHDRLLWEKRGPEYTRRLANSDVPIIMRKQFKDIRRSERFPLQKVSAIVGDYYGSSISYMIAYAIYKKVDKLQIWGVDLSDEGAYGHQRPNLEYLIGFARGQGMQVEVCGPSKLLERRTDDFYQDQFVYYPERYGALT